MMVANIGDSSNRGTATECGAVVDVVGSRMNLSWKLEQASA